MLLGALLLFVTCCNGYKILMVCPPPAKSHNNLCRGVTETLADAGHELTFLTAFSKDGANYKEIVVDELIAMKDKISPGALKIQTMSKMATINFLASMQPNMAEIFFSHKGVINMMEDKTQKFDLIISEYFLNEYLLGFSVKYDCPAILLSPVPMMSWLTIMSGNVLSMATVPNVFTPFSSNMNLWQRSINVLAVGIQDIMERILLKPIQRELYKKYFPKEAEKVPFDELKNRISAIFINSHPTLSVARPLLPNSIEIGGYHIAEPEPLPADLKSILDNAKEGVIFMSMGSHLKSSDFSPEMQKVFFNTFGSLEKTILWKYEVDIEDKPKNIHIRKWLPQTGILAHPNVKLFISHGGLLSCTEATHFGVPLLIIPMFGDQHHNAQGFSDRGLAVTLSFDDITETSLNWALKESLNKRYYHKVKENQKLYQDRPIKPRELITYYSEHVIRSKGAFHLSPPKLSRVSDLLIDVALVFFTLFFGVILVIFFLCKKCCGKKENRLLKKKNKKQ